MKSRGNQHQTGGSFRKDRAEMNRIPKPARSIRKQLFNAIFSFSTCFLILSLFVSIAILRNSWFDQTTRAFQRTSSQINNMVGMRTEELKQLMYSLILNDNIAKLFSNNFAGKYDEYTARENIDKLLTSMHTRYQPLCVFLILEKTQKVYTNSAGYRAQTDYESFSTSGLLT